MRLRHRGGVRRSRSSGHWVIAVARSMAKYVLHVASSRRGVATSNRWGGCTRIESRRSVRSNARRAIRCSRSSSISQEILNRSLRTASTTLRPQPSPIVGAMSARLWPGQQIGPSNSVHPAGLGRYNTRRDIPTAGRGNPGPRTPVCLARREASASEALRRRRLETRTLGEWRHSSADQGQSRALALQDEPQSRPARPPPLLSQHHPRRWSQIKELSEYLGHHDPGFTLQQYTHLLPVVARGRQAGGRSPAGAPRFTAHGAVTEPGPPDRRRRGT